MKNQIMVEHKVTARRDPLPAIRLYAYKTLLFGVCYNFVLNYLSLSLSSSIFPSFSFSISLYRDSAE